MLLFNNICLFLSLITENLLIHKIYPPVKLYPFSKDCTDSVHENQWVGLYEHEFPKDNIFYFDDEK